MQKKHSIEELIKKYLDDALSNEERLELEYWLKGSPGNQQLLNQLRDSEWITRELEQIDVIDTIKGWERIEKAIINDNHPVKNINPAHRSRWKFLIAAASIIWITFAAGWLILRDARKEVLFPAKVAVENIKDIKPPEKNRATITLPNGKLMYLDSVADGTNILQSGVNLVKRTDGEVVYQPNTSAGKLIYHTMFNPRGSKAISLLLSDGTKVWLNSETTLRYPVNFITDVREVEMVGEAYFEVAKNPSKPFTVKTGDIEVEVIGTHFNINAYSDEEKTETTLLEGKIRLRKGETKVEINPGQQVRFYKEDAHPFKVQSNADVEKAIAWKQEMFQFDNTTLPVIMRQIGRWYDKDIIFEKTASTELYGGGISRQAPLINVLKLLEANGVKFRLQGNSIVVKP